VILALSCGSLMYVEVVIASFFEMVGGGGGCRNSCEWKIA